MFARVAPVVRGTSTSSWPVIIGFRQAEEGSECKHTGQGCERERKEAAEGGQV